MNLLFILHEHFFVLSFQCSFLFPHVDVDTLWDSVLFIVYYFIFKKTQFNLLTFFCLNISHCFLDFLFTFAACEKTFITFSALFSHNRTHFKETGNFTCTYPGCDKTYDKACRLKIHMRSHTGKL